MGYLDQHYKAIMDKIKPGDKIQWGNNKGLYRFIKFMKCSFDDWYCGQYCPGKLYCVSSKGRIKIDCWILRGSMSQVKIIEEGTYIEDELWNLE